MLCYEFQILKLACKQLRSQNTIPDKVYWGIVNEHWKIAQWKVVLPNGFPGSELAGKAGGYLLGKSGGLPFDLQLP